MSWQLEPPCAAAASGVLHWTAEEVGAKLIRSLGDDVPSVFAAALVAKQIDDANVPKLRVIHGSCMMGDRAYWHLLMQYMNTHESCIWYIFSDGGLLKAENGPDAMRAWRGQRWPRR